MTQRRRLLAAAALSSLGGLGSLPARAQQDSALERVKQRGILSVAVYKELPPFSGDDGKGIDIEIASALAEGLGVKPSLLIFGAGENIGDDLRNAVWRGHYLGWGPADVMLHVPMDRPLIEANPQVEVFGPYYRERVMLAWDKEQGPEPESLAALKGKPAAVAGSSLAGWLLASADSGSLAPTLDTQHPDGFSAARALLAGKAVAAAGLASELESAIGPASKRYAILPIPSPRAPRNGWVIGCAVKKGNSDLARVIQDRLVQMGNSNALRDIFARHGVSWKQ